MAEISSVTLPNGESYNLKDSDARKKLSGIEDNANNYVLPAATKANLGGIKVGQNLTMTDGVLSGTANNKYNFSVQGHTLVIGESIDTTSTTTTQIKAQAKSAVPKTKAQTIVPDEGYDYISSVTVDPIPTDETANTTGTTFEVATEG